MIEIDENKKEIINRFKDLAKIRFGSLKNLEIALGLKIGYLSSYFSKEIVPNFEIMQFLAQRYNVNINWLLTGKGSMLVNVENVEVIDSPQVSVPILTNEVALELIRELREARKSNIGLVAEKEVEYK